MYYLEYFRTNGEDQKFTPVAVFKLTNQKTDLRWTGLCKCAPNIKVIHSEMVTKLQQKICQNSKEKYVNLLILTFLIEWCHFQVHKLSRSRDTDAKNSCFRWTEHTLHTSLCTASPNLSHFCENQNGTKKCDRQTNRPSRPTNFEMLERMVQSVFRQDQPF